MVKICICDDDPKDRDTLAKALRQYDLSLNVTQYGDGKLLMEDCLLHETLYDVIFLDIQMPEISGIEIAKRIQENIKDAIIVFITSSTDYYSQAYEVFAFNYLVKPVNFVKLKLILDKALDKINNERRAQLVISYKGVAYRIFIRDILFIESSNKDLLFHMNDNTVIKYYSKMDDVLKNPSLNQFIRCHQSYAVNSYYITKMVNTNFLIGEHTINISKKYHKEAATKYHNLLLTKL